MTRRPDLWRSLGFVVLTVVLLTGLFLLGRRLEMDTKLFSFRYLGQGQVMAALDVLLGSEPYDHQFNIGLIPVADKYWNGPGTVPLAEVLAEARPQLLPLTQAARGWVVDDKGYVDLIAMGFALFGVGRSSVFYMYFVVLGLTLTIYSVWAFAHPKRLALAPLFLLALLTVTPILAIDDQLSGLHEQRFFAAMGIVPLIHVLLVMRDARGPRPLSVLAVAFQAVILAFVYHCRNDSLWQLMAIVCSVPIFLLIRSRALGAGRALVGVSWPAAIAGLAFFGILVFQQLTYAKAYYTAGYASHVYSHNMVMGLSYDPLIAAEFDLAVDDGKVIKLVARKLGIDDAAGLVLFNNDFHAYSAGARAALVSIVRRHPFRSIAAFAWYKPAGAVREILYAAGLNSEAAASRSGHRLVAENERRARSLYYNPFTLLNLAILALVLMLGGTATDGWRELVGVVLIALVFSCAVPIMAAPMLYLMGPSLVMLALALHLALIGMASFLRNAVETRLTA